MSKVTHAIESERLRKAFRRFEALPASYLRWLPASIQALDQGWLEEQTFCELSFMMRLLYHCESKRGYDFSKNLVERAFALFLLIVFSPVFIAVATLIACTTRGPVFYTQLRVGHFRKPFWLFKFRTMQMNAESEIHPALGRLAKKNQDERVTWIGKFLRKHKLDEFPQLWNVVKGDMSFVGPRPLSVDDSATIARKYQLRYAVRPGMTGLWQGYYSSYSDYATKLCLDCYYVKKRGLLLDLALIFATVPTLVYGERYRPVRDKGNKLEPTSTPPESAKVA